MKGAFVFVLWIVTLSAQSQRLRLAEQLKIETVDYYDSLIEVSDTRLNPLKFDPYHGASLAISHINEKRRQRAREALVQDSLLNQICAAGLKSFSKFRFRNRSLMPKEKLQIQKIVNQYRMSERALSARVFTIDLLDWPKTARYYYLKRCKKSPMQLYKGKQPSTTNPDMEGYVEPIPILAVTERQFVERFLIRFIRSGSPSELTSRKFSKIGLAFRIDEKTIGRQKRPTVYAMVLVTGKKLQEVQVKSFIEEEYEKDLPHE